MFLYRNRALATFCFVALIFHKPSIQTLPVPNELRYSLLQESCSIGVFFASNMSGLADVVRNTNKTVCVPSLGVKSVLSESGVQDRDSLYGLISSWTTKDMLKPMVTVSGALNFEVWLKNGKLIADNQLRPIVSVASPLDLSEQPMDLSVCSHYNADFILGIRNSVLEVHYRATSAILEPCRVIQYDAPLQAHRLMHVVVSLQDGEQRVFVNGQGPAIRRDSFTRDLSQWNGNYRLALLRDHAHLSGPWPGVLYLVSISSQKLNSSSINDKLMRGLPRTMPFAQNRTIVLHEDAEVSPESHEPGWYEQSPEFNEAQLVELRIGWTQRDVHELITSLGFALSSNLQPVHTYITELPTKGCLYRMDGSHLGCGDNNNTNATSPLLIGTSHGEPQTIMYLPPFNQYSKSVRQFFASIRYCVSEVFISYPGDCLSAEIALIVLPVNDPPKALPVDEVLVQEGVDSYRTPRILLSGVDVDEGDKVQQVRITRPPKFGFLALSVGSFRQDGLPNGVKLSELNHTIRGLDPVTVKYFLYPNSIMVRDRESTDSFMFRVADRQGMWSREEMVTLRMASAVTIESEPSVFVVEASNNTLSFRWFANDTSGLRRHLRFLVESLPAAEFGSVLDGRTLIKEGTLVGPVIKYPYERSASLSFIPSDHYCHTRADLEAHVSVSFRAVAHDANNSIVSMSQNKMQQIFVKCISDPLSISLPAKRITTRAQSLAESLNTRCNGHMFDIDATDKSGCPTAEVIEGISCENKDLLDESVVLSINTRLGYLSFNPQAWNLTSPVLGRRSLTRNTTVVASVDDLTDVLARLHYQSLNPGEDVIELELFHGACGILNRSAQPIHLQTCQKTIKRLLVTVESGSEKRWHSNSAGACFPWQILFCWLGYPAIYYGYCSIINQWRGWYDCDHQDKDENSQDEETVCHGELPHLWIQHRSDDGDYYYQHVKTGTVTWMAPVDETFVAWTGQQDSDSIA